MIRDTENLAHLVHHLYCHRPAGNAVIHIPYDELVLDRLVNQDEEGDLPFPVTEVKKILETLEPALTIIDEDFHDFYIVTPLAYTKAHTVTLLDVEAAIEELDYRK